MDELYSSAKREPALASYLPEIVAGCREIKAVFAAVEPELCAASNNCSELREAGFIEHCPERLLKRFERLFGVSAAPSDTPSERRTRLIIRRDEAPPYTEAALRKKLAAVCGEGGFTLEVDHGSFTVSVTAERLGEVQLAELSRMLRAVCPANLVIKLTNTAKLQARGAVWSGGVTVFSAVISA